MSLHSVEASSDEALYGLEADESDESDEFAEAPRSSRWRQPSVSRPSSRALGRRPPQPPLTSQPAQRFKRRRLLHGLINEYKPAA
jgi:hypothetical protein